MSTIFVPSPLDPVWQYIMNDDEDDEDKNASAEAGIHHGMGSTGDTRVRRVRFNLESTDDPYISFLGFLTDAVKDPEKGETKHSPKILRPGKYTKKMEIEQGAGSNIRSLFGSTKGKPSKLITQSKTSSGVRTLRSRNLPDELPMKSGQAMDKEDESSIFSFLYQLSKKQNDQLMVEQSLNLTGICSEDREDQALEASTASAKRRFRKKKLLIDYQSPPESRDDTFFDQLTDAIFPDASIYPHSKESRAQPPALKSQQFDAVTENSKKKRFPLRKLGILRSLDGERSVSDSAQINMGVASNDVNDSSIRDKSLLDLSSEQPFSFNLWGFFDETDESEEEESNSASSSSDDESLGSGESIEDIEVKAPFEQGKQQVQDETTAVSNERNVSIGEAGEQDLLKQSSSPGCSGAYDRVGIKEMHSNSLDKLLDVSNTSTIGFFARPVVPACKQSKNTSPIFGSTTRPKLSIPGSDATRVLPFTDESKQPLLSFDGMSKSCRSSTSRASVDCGFTSEVIEPKLEFWTEVDEAQRPSMVRQWRCGRVMCYSGKQRIEDGDDLEFSSRFPQVRMIADEEGSQKPVTASGAEIQDFMSPLSVTSDAITARRGPQSVYTYEYETGPHMDISFGHFGDRPCHLSKVLTYMSPPLFRVAPDDVLIKIEASTISSTDCMIRSGGWWRDEMVPLPIVPGVDLVGKVETIDTRIAKQYKLKKGDRVVSLIKWGGNSRYKRISPQQLVKVQGVVDPAEVACLAEAYLAAFQVVHHGQRTGLRYKQHSLAGKSIIVLGALTSMGRAVVELANAAGAAIVYATGKEKKTDSIQRLGAQPLSRKMDWLPELAGKIDLIIDASSSLVCESNDYLKALKDDGAFIFMGATRKEVDIIISSWSKPIRLVCTSQRHKMENMIHSYDVYASWENNTEGCKRDLTHLISLLEKGDIKPKVIDRVPLNKVARAHEILDSKSLQGHLVCEPWMKSMERAVYL